MMSSLFSLCQGVDIENHNGGGHDDMLLSFVKIWYETQFYRTVSLHVSNPPDVPKQEEY